MKPFKIIPLSTKDSEPFYHSGRPAIIQQAPALAIAHQPPML